MKRSDAPLADHVTDKTGSAGLPKVSLLVTDLDNTLWDWVYMWHRSFSPLLDGMLRISGIPREQLIPAIREVHQLRRTAEYSFLIGELQMLRDKHGTTADLQEIYREAIEAARDARINALRLYPGVLETLSEIKEQGTTIAAYTESLAFWTSYRIKKLDLDGILDYVYSPPDHDFPAGISAEDLRTRESDRYELKATIHRPTPIGVTKPSPAILNQIISDLGDSGGVAGVVYVGDSLMKDIAMAQEVGARDAWAKYGVAQQRDEYELLREVTHWTDADVERERQIARRPNVTPSVTLDDRFAELLNYFEFVKNGRR